MGITVANNALLVTTGEPAGIGMDIILQLAKQDKLQKLQRPVIVLCDEIALTQRAVVIYGTQMHQDHSHLWQRITTAEILHQQSDAAAYLQQRLTESQQQQTKAVAFYVIHVACAAPVEAGILNEQNAAMVFTQLKLAHQLATLGAVAAIVTGPLQKSILIDAGITLADGSMFTGHTEFFMQQSGCDKVVMMLANAMMKVALVTTHLPLVKVAEAITKDNVRQTVQILITDLQQKFGLKQPKVLVCGLNPHAGEDGHLGREEIEVINPVLEEFQQQGVDISLTMPADTLFTPDHLQHCDAVLAMYHDQGLPVLKSHGFGDTVNLTLGLPYIRTSVDHGTALDLAGNVQDSGLQPSSHSLWRALT
ncbi:4-hydroxythreonine-4-phosphate dehydrogenase PdxA, partial [Psychrobacter lutiphocae]